MFGRDSRLAIKRLSIPETRRSQYADMKQKLINLSQRYVRSLQKFIRPGPPASLQPALRLGREAVILGLETLELARIHDRALTVSDLRKGKDGVARRAEIFFTEAIAPIVETHRAARQNKDELHRLNGTLDRRMADLTATNRRLQHGIVRRKNVESTLKKSDQHHTRLLKESLQMQENLRHLTHQLLAAQEDERKKISRKLQNEIAQTLLGINVRLLSLKREARNNTKGFKNEIASTQRLVIKSAKSVRRVARGFGGL